MPDLNKQELRRLAHEAFETECLWLDRSWLASIMAEDWADYLVALEPVVVIALLDECADQKLQTEAARSTCLEVQSALNASIAERDQLRAEVDSLRQDAERYRWTSSGVQEAETLLSVVLCHGGDSVKIAERVDIYMEANKEASHD